MQTFNLAMRVREGGTIPRTVVPSRQGRRMLDHTIPSISSRLRRILTDIRWRANEYAQMVESRAHRAHPERTLKAQGGSKWWI
jgi:hypothetical protein